MDALTTALPSAFRAQLETHFGQETAQRVLKAMDEPASTSIRINPNKAFQTFEKATAIPWTHRGWTLSARPTFALDPHFHAGAYYVQDSSSMVLERVLETVLPHNEPVLALDACAAPGGKSLIVLDAIGQNGFLISNEVDGRRHDILQENLLKWGQANHATTQLSTSALRRSGPVFDLVVTDAPCSGEGMFRKDDFARRQWSPDLVNQCAYTQRSITKDVQECLRPGGILIYATCTMNQEENEAQVLALLEDGFELLPMGLDVFEQQIIPAHHGASVLGYYLLPGLSGGEGLFISALQKTGSSQGQRSTFRRSATWKPFPSAMLADFGADQVHFDRQWSRPGQSLIFGVSDPHQLLDRLPSDFPFKTVGLPCLESKGRDVLPQHGLAMSPGIKVSTFLNEKDALNYLRKERISVSEFQPRGWHCVGFENQALGWIKAIEGRVNNYYPAPYRLRML